MAGGRHHHGAAVRELTARVLDVRDRVLRVVAARWLELPPERGASFLLGTATLSELGFERETRVLARWNG